MRTFFLRNSPDEYRIRESRRNRHEEEIGVTLYFLKHYVFVCNYVHIENAFLWSYIIYIHKFGRPNDNLYHMYCIWELAPIIVWVTTEKVLGTHQTNKRLEDW
jgi:hypothetical protein